MSTIQNFYDTAVNYDFARLHQFRLIDWQRDGTSVFSADVQDLQVYLETASLPSRETTNVPVPFMGLSFNIPGLATYSGSAGYSVTFRCDKAYIIRNLVEIETRKTFDDRESTGNINTPGKDSIMTIGLLGPESTETFIGMYTLVGVRLLNTGTIEYNLGDTGQVAKVTGTLTYHYWHPGEDPNGGQ